MTTAPVHHTARPAAPRRHLRLVTDAPARRRATRPGTPQRAAAASAGLVCGFVLAAWGAVLGGGSPAGLMAAASVASAVLFVALVACRAGVRRRARAAARTRARLRAAALRSVPVAPAFAAPVSVPDNVVPLRRAA